MSDMNERWKYEEGLFGRLPAPEKDSITITWHIDDVKTVRPDLTDEQAREVLWHAKQYHDANVGINWEVLEAHANYIFGKEGE